MNLNVSTARSFDETGQSKSSDSRDTPNSLPTISPPSTLPPQKVAEIMRNPGGTDSTAPSAIEVPQQRHQDPASGGVPVSISAEGGATPTTEEGKVELLKMESSDDEDVRYAKAMAMAIQQNPNMSAEEIRKLTGSIISDSSQRKALPAGNDSASNLLIPGRLSDLLKGQSQQDLAAGGGAGGAAPPADVATAGDEDSPPSPSKEKKPTIKSNFKMMQHALKSHTQHAKGGILSMASGKNFNLTPNSMPTVKSFLHTKTGKEKSPTSNADTINVTASNVSDLETPNLDEAGQGHPSDAAAFNTAPAEEEEEEAKDAPIRLTDVVWKRRSGLGKYSTSSAWERRRVVLRGSRIYYYRTDAEAQEEDEAKEKHDSNDENHNTGITKSNSKDQDDLDTSGLAPPSVAPKRESSDSIFQPSFPSLTSYKIDGTTLKKNFLELASGLGLTEHEDPNAPRGYLDLVKEKATVSATSGHSGAPSPFAISIKVKGETKWKLCFPFHKTQMEWLAALTDAIVQASVDSYNKELVDCTDPTLEHSLFQPLTTVNEPSNDATNAPGSASASTGHHKLWMLEPYSIHGQHGKEEVDDDDDKDDTTDASSSVMEELTLDEGSTLVTSRSITTPTSSARGLGDSTQQEIMFLESEDAKLISNQALYYIAITWNISLILARASSTSIEGFWFLVTFSNLALYVCQDKRLVGIKPSASVTATPHKQNIIQPSASTQLRTPAKVVPGSAVKTRDTPKSSKKDLSKTPVQPDGYKPVAGTSAMVIENATDLPVNKDNVVFAGWRRPDPETFQVRSHGYLSTKKKVCSPGTLYKCDCVDIFESPSRYPDMAARVKLPKVKFDDSKGPKTWKCPDVFVISVSLPTDPPKLGRTTDDGGGYTVTMYYVMEQETREILRRVTADDYDPSTDDHGDDIQRSKINAVKLLEEWCKKSPTDPKMQARFKLIPNVENLTEIGMPQWIAKYNGKPVLIKRAGQTGFLYDHTMDPGDGPSCMEFDVSFHVFPYLAKQAICYLKDNFFKKILMSFGFVIEGRDDDELPECLLGTMQICYPNPVYAIQGEDFFGGSCPLSSSI